MILETNQSKISSVLAFLFLTVLFIHPFISEMAYPILGGYIRAAILFIFLLYLLIIKGLRVSIKPFDKPLILYMLSITISLFYSINLRSSLHEIYQLIPLICLLIVASNLDNRQSNKLISVILLSASILSIYGIYQYLWGFEHTREYLNLHLRHLLETRYVQEILLTRRAIATFFSPNMFGAYIVTAIPLCAGVLFNNIIEKKPYVLAGTSLIFLFIAVVLTKSLAAWISLSFGVIVFFMLARRFLNRIAWIICIFILLMPLFLLFLRYDMFINLANQQNTLLQRLSFWRTTTEIIRDFPLKGIGPGNLGNIYPKYRELVANETRFAHNIFLQTWAETGLLGIVSIIFLVIVFIKVSLNIKRNLFNIGLMTSCYVFIINNLFDFSYFIPQISFLWWINLGLILQKYNPINNKSNNTIRLLMVIIILLAIYLNIKSLAALVYFQKGTYKRAIALEPYNDLYYIAIKEYDKAIELNPYSPFYHKDLAIFYLNKNMIKEAISEFEKASKLYPANESLHQRLFDLYTKVGDTEKAKKEEAKLKEFYSRYSGYFIR